MSNCGTENGYSRHRYYDEPPCDACRRAHSKAVKDRKPSSAVRLHPEGTIWYQDTSWKERAACRDADPAIFFPQAGGVLAAQQAKAYCEACPVQGECLEFAASNAMRYGIWGGRTEKQRRKVKLVPCTVEGCEGPVKAKGMCGTHYARAWRAS